MSLEYEIVTKPDLTIHIAMEYQSMVLLYDRILREKSIPANKSDKTWSWSSNNYCKSLKKKVSWFCLRKNHTNET